MKLLMNVALIAALSLSAGACTVVTDPSSGSSGGSSSSSTLMNRQEQVAAFTAANLERIKQDMATGQGEYLASLASLLGVEAAQQPAFFAFTQSKFPVLFPHSDTSAAQMLTSLEREMRAQPDFAQRLALR